MRRDCSGTRRSVAVSLRRWGSTATRTKAVAACANTSGPVLSARCMKSIAGRRGATVCSMGTIRLRCRCRRASTGTRGSAPRPSATSTQTCIRTAGTSGTILATVRSATWPAILLIPPTGRSNSRDRRRWRSRICMAASAGFGPSAPASAGISPPAKAWIPSKFIFTTDLRRTSNIASKRWSGGGETLQNARINMFRRCCSIWRRNTAETLGATARCSWATRAS